MASYARSLRWKFHRADVKITFHLSQHLIVLTFTLLTLYQYTLFLEMTSKYVG